MNPKIKRELLEFLLSQFLDDVKKIYGDTPGCYASFEICLNEKNGLSFCPVIFYTKESHNVCAVSGNSSGAIAELKLKFADLKRDKTEAM